LHDFTDPRSAGGCRRDHLRKLGPAGVVTVGRERDRRQHANDGHDDHYLDQGEAALQLPFRELFHGTSIVLFDEFG
jgi:hypothetical protein